MAYPLNVIVIVTMHYATNDPEFTSDYCAIDIKIDGITLAEYGDSYHDRGRDKAEGFVDALKIFHPDWQIQHVKVADYEI